MEREKNQRHILEVIAKMNDDELKHVSEMLRQDGEVSENKEE